MIQQQLLRRVIRPNIRAFLPQQPVPNTVRRRLVHLNEVKLEGAADNAFNRDRLAMKLHAEKSSELWRKLSIYVCIPALILASLNAWNLWNEHWEHWETLPPLDQRPQYSYLNIRTKKFFWGDGDKTLL
ncbi:MAG: hypothetical protein Q9190_005992 [Brigantiaea leucoxantha]